MKVLFVFSVIFPFVQIVTRTCLLLDHILFPGFRKIKIEQPVFITGLFRSGTTFIHRLLCKDSTNFTAFKTWEIYLAPSILQRKFLKLLKKIDHVFGAPLYRFLLRYEKNNLNTIKLHNIALFAEEEDEGLFLFQWNSLFTWYFFPIFKGMEDYIYFDKRISRRKQDRMYRYYRNCIKRHLYCHPRARYFISKNPTFSPRLEALKRYFPDARILYMVREPALVIPSQFNWFSFAWNYFASPLEQYPFKEEVLRMCRYWYEYPLRIFEEWDEGHLDIVEYRDLIYNPLAVIQEIYGHFQLELSDVQREILKNETKKVSKYKSPKTLSLSCIGMTYDELREQFGNIYSRFEFDGKPEEDRP